MRLWPLAILTGLVAGCAGNMADYVGPRELIVAPQLTRFGFDAEQTQCVANKLADTLRPLQLRLLTRTAEVVTQGYFDPPNLTPRDMRHVANSMADTAISEAFNRAADECQVVVTVEAPPPATADAPAEPAAPPPPAWLNLGAAPTGQSIAVDAASVVNDGQMRRAWVRLTNPGATAPPDVSYLVRLDCAGRTIEALADRRQDQQGTVLESNEYAADAAGPLPIEGGTVMEIAYLALCT